VDDKDWVLIVVRDSGPGISATELNHLFERFFTTKPQGMGLPICRSIIQAQHCKISGANDPDGGVTFCIALPGSRHRIL
jgi:signal transduction histidine kinase